METKVDVIYYNWEVRVAYEGEQNCGWGFKVFDHKPTTKEIKEAVAGARKSYPSNHPLVWSLHKTSKRIIEKEKEIIPWTLE